MKKTRLNYHYLNEEYKGLLPRRKLIKLDTTIAVVNLKIPFRNLKMRPATSTSIVNYMRLSPSYFFVVLGLYFAHRTHRRTA